MERFRTILTPRYPYPHEHSQHAITAVVAGSLFFISTDNMHTLIHKLDNNIKWWSMYACLFGFFYFFSSPFLGKTIQPSYSNFSRWYVAWLLISTIYHLPSLQSMGVDIKMNVSLFLTLFLSSVLVLVIFHIMFLGLWYMGLVARVAGKQPEILTILQNSAVLSIACCVFYSHCGNRAPSRGKSLGRRHSGRFVLENLNKSDNGTWYSRLPHMHELKEQVCSTWFAPVGSASDYPVFSKWVIYGELVSSEACAGPSDDISPIYSLWATFIGLYIANYVVERSTGWAMTHPQSLPNSEKQKTPMAPDFLDMVPWYSGTSADLFKTVFDLLVSVTLFLGRFDMRMMQSAMSRAQESAPTEGFLYDHLSTRGELWFDFMADTGDGGNSSYTVARLLAQPSLRVSNEDHFDDLPRGDLLLIGGDLAYPNPSPFTYEERLFRPFEYALQPPSCYKTEHIAVNKPELPEGVGSLQHYDGPQCFAIPGNHDWFDGLHIFMRYICHKSWLGGWLLPQHRSYFALQLPHGWWIFGLDQALHGDIDIYQFKFFSELAKNQCELDYILQDDTWHGHVQHFIGALWRAFTYMLGYSYVSLAGTVMLLLISILFVPGKVSRRRRAIIGFLHVAAHLTAALVLMLLLELGIETCVRHKLLGTSGYHTLYQWYRSVESEHFPDPTGLRNRIEEWTFGLYPACIKYLMSAFDVPEVMAVTRSNICKSGMETFPRGFTVMYYICIFLYFWVFSTPVVSLVFGSYLYICVNWLHIHFDEAFSSLRIANYKAFTRFHITSQGSLEVYTLAVDKVPKEWKLDANWEAEQKKQLPTYLRRHPSKWTPKSPYQDPNCRVRIIDHFVVERQPH